MQYSSHPGNVATGQGQQLSISGLSYHCCDERFSRPHESYLAALIKRYLVPIEEAAVQSQSFLLPLARMDDRQHRCHCAMTSRKSVRAGLSNCSTRNHVSLPVYCPIRCHNCFARTREPGGKPSIADHVFLSHPILKNATSSAQSHRRARLAVVAPAPAAAPQ